MKCKHRNWIDVDVHGFPAVGFASVNMCRRWCWDCNSHIGFGPANDGCPLDDAATYEAVAIERHAAALIADAETGTERSSTWQVAVGVIDYDLDKDPPTGILAPLWHAGWLARHVWSAS